MLQALKMHHKINRNLIRERLNDFKKNKNATNKEFLEEMTFCVFAANSSAKMGLKATELLKNILEKGNLDDYQNAVYKKVRFYNVRSKYLHENKLKLNEKISEHKKSISKILQSHEHHERREFIKKNFKGFGMKESSHLLRNLGYNNYCIIDKHVLNTLNELGVLKSNSRPKNEKEYLEIENKIISFAKKHKIDIDELDLAIWSFKTGEIIK